MYKEDLALNNPSELICDKHNQTIIIWIEKKHPWISCRGEYAFPSIDIIKSSFIWSITDNPAKKTFRARRSVNKVTVLVTWHMKGPTTIDFFEKGAILNNTSYCQLLMQYFTSFIVLSSNWTLLRFFVYLFNGISTFDGYLALKQSLVWSSFMAYQPL